MTSLEIGQEYEAQLESLAEKLGDLNSATILVMASGIVSSGDPSVDAVQFFSEVAYQKLRDLGAAVEWLSGPIHSPPSRVEVSPVFQDLASTRVSKCRRRWSEAGITEYLLELTFGEDVLTTLWVALDPSANGLFVTSWPGSIVDVATTLRASERPAYRPFRKVSPEAARQSINGSSLVISELVEEDDLAKAWNAHGPLLRFVIDRMQWGSASATDPDQNRCV